MQAKLLEKPPTRAGYAQIRFDPGRHQTVLAGISGRVITVFRRFDEVDIYRLMGGQQLLITEPAARRTYGDVFCGTDEQPFATGVEAWHLANLLRGGEHAFYNGLVPPDIRVLRDILGPDAIWRQGDIHGAEIAPSRRRFEREHRQGQPVHWTPVSRQGIMKTRHQVTGHASPALTFDQDGYQLKGRLVTGAVTAPDHATRLVGVSLLRRTPGLLPGVWSHGVRLLGD